MIRQKIHLVQKKTWLRLKIKFGVQPVHIISAHSITVHAQKDLSHYSTDPQVATNKLVKEMISKQVETVVDSILIV